MSVLLIRAIANAPLPLGADMEVPVQNTTTTVVEERPFVVIVRVATIVSDPLDDQMITMPETMDDAPPRETHMDHRLHDENHMATILTIEVRHHHREATVPIRTSEMVTHMLVGHGAHQEEVTEAVMQPMMTEDTGEVPASIYDSTLLASVESHVLRLIRTDHVRRGDITAERISL